MPEEDKETRKARIEAHRVFDRIWNTTKGPGKQKARRDAYKWMREAMGLSISQAHISLLNQEQCEELIKLVYRDYPHLRTFEAHLLYGDEFR